MVLVEEDAVVVHATGVTPTTGMLAVLPDTTVTGADVASLLPVLLEPRRHFLSSAPLSLPHYLFQGFIIGNILTPLSRFLLMMRKWEMNMLVTCMFIHMPHMVMLMDQLCPLRVQLHLK